jgi:putative transposase
VELTSEVFEYIEGFYNLRRRHSTLGMHSPADYEKILARLRVAVGREGGICFSAGV